MRNIIGLILLMAAVVILFYALRMDEVFFKTGMPEMLPIDPVAEIILDYESEVRFQASQKRVLGTINR